MTGRWMTAMLLLTVLPMPTRAQTLQRKLDRQVSLNVENRPVGEVFARLAGSAGVDIELAQDTLDYLPYGERTELTVTLKDVTLRKALPAMLRPQGLDWSIKDEAVVINPSDALYRMGRRATYDELQRLGTLLTATVRQPADSLRDTLRQATGLDDLTLRLVDLPGGHAALDSARTTARSALPATAADYLDALCDAAKLSWHLDGNSVVLLPRAKQIRRQLQRTVSLRYQNARLAQVLLDLARKARVRLTLTPGLLKMLPAEVRTNYSLIMADATIAQALEVISGNTGIEFLVQGDGLHARPSVFLEVQAGANGQRGMGGVFLETTLQTSSGHDVKVYILPDQLPPDLREAILKRREALIEDLRRQYGTGDQPER